jgi:hypothetical protein
MKNKKVLLGIIIVVLLVPAIIYLILGQKALEHRIFILGQAIMLGGFAMIALFLVVGFQVLNPMCNKQFFVLTCYFFMFGGFAALILSLITIFMDLEASISVLYMSIGTIITSYFMKVKFSPRKDSVTKRKSLPKN